MGNHRFRLSDMIPNAWFYKLRDMNTTRTRNSHPKKKHAPPSSSPTSTATTTFYHLSSPPHSYYHTTAYNPFSDPPKRKTVYKPSEIQIAQTGTTSSSEEDGRDDDSSSTLPELIGLEESVDFRPRKPVSKVSGVRLRGNDSPRIAVRKIRRSSARNKRAEKMELPESVAMVKASVDPQKDFKESMMEMIEENDMKCSRDLEELLACYLSLNPEEYHHLIIKAFEQIWFELPHLDL
ncbi:transcription repressor OFP2-like [Ipomoea triloba]|uniref:transcription repressor OFP2-like n=1 Tax=Ipomoea triloba TaxID=35885 RepID=UPI00125CE9C4|nr:transcription repressor OFP2-like [Ipomoea triloba]